MLNFSFSIRNPWSQQFKNLWNRVYATPHKNKFIELEIYKDSSLVSLNANVTTRQSHAGIDIEVGLLGYCFHFNLYDSRHWNYDEGRWMAYTEEEGYH